MPCLPSTVGTAPGAASVTTHFAFASCCPPVANVTPYTRSVDRELTSQLESMERSLNRQGLKLERYLEYVGQTLDRWMAAQRPDAEARLKIDLVLAEYARRENLEPSDDEVITYLEEQAAADDELKDQVAELKKSPSARRYFASRLRRRRVLDRLVEVASSRS